MGLDDLIPTTDPAVIIAGIRQFGLAPDGSDLRDLAAAVERLQGTNRRAMKIADERSIQNVELRAEIGRLRAALAFYADYDNWNKNRPDGDRITGYCCGNVHVTDASGLGFPVAICDRGVRARAALEQNGT